MPRILIRLSLFLLFTFFLNLCPLWAQFDSTNIKNDTLHRGRLALVISVESAIAVGAFVGLNELWYKDYPRSSFHFFNDNDEWLQMDKLGHTYSSYSLGHLGFSTLKWSGVSENKSIWYGSTLGLTYMLIIETLDGFSKGWGFSWGDFTANIAGSALFACQQFGWHQQRFLLKTSFHPSLYASLNPNLLGANFLERRIKDYNGQTYWLTASPGAFLKPEKKFPRWVSLSVGYGAEGMIGARTNQLSNGTSYPEYSRNRRFFLSLDVDLSKIPIKSKFWRTVISFFNSLKMPFPALEFNTSKGFRGHWLYL